MLNLIKEMLFKLMDAYFSVTLKCISFTWEQGCSIANRHLDFSTMLQAMFQGKPSLWLAVRHVYKPSMMLIMEWQMKIVQQEDEHVLMYGSCNNA